MEKNEYAIIVAGGIGTRMENDLPKQFIKVAGMPIIMHTIKTFYTYSKELNIIVVLPENQLDKWEELKTRYQFKIPHHVVIGGESRFQSVKLGLEFINDKDALVAVHDAVRPIVSDDVIRRSFQVADHQGSAITAVPLKDSIRKEEGDTTKAVARTQFKIVQTPQTFKFSLLKEAYQQEESVAFTDDATVYEGMGHEINLIDGSYRNIKITTPEDLIIAEALLNK